MSFLRPLESFIGMFHGLLGMLVPGLVIFFSVVRGTVRMCAESWNSAALWCASLGIVFPIPDDRSILGPFHFPNCSILYTRAAARILHKARTAFLLIKIRHQFDGNSFQVF